MYSFRFKLYARFVTAIAMTLFITNGTGLISLYLTDTAGNGATEADWHMERNIWKSL